MTTSGATTFKRNRDQLIGAALRKISAVESGETPDAQAVQDASDALNVMVKHWQASGIHIWTMQEAILFPALGQVQYTIGTGSTDRITGAFVQTTLSAAAALGAGSVVLTSVSGVATTYNIGVQLDDGTFQWTTVNGAPSGSTVTLTAVLTDSAASGNVVLVYQSSLVRPVKVLDARRFNLTSLIDVPLTEMDRAEYMDMPNKTSTGAINGFFYDRRGGTNTQGLIYFWPSPETITEVIKLTVARPIEDFTVAADDADLPLEWIRAIEWGLADELADEYDVPEPKRSRIEKRAARYLGEVNWWERELISFQLVPDNGR